MYTLILPTNSSGTKQIEVPCYTLKQAVSLRAKLYIEHNMDRYFRNKAQDDVDDESPKSDATESVTINGIVYCRLLQRNKRKNTRASAKSFPYYHVLKLNKEGKPKYCDEYIAPGGIIFTDKQIERMILDAAAKT